MADEPPHGRDSTQRASGQHAKWSQATVQAEASAADGQAGVPNVLDVMRSGIDSGLMGLGVSSVHQLTPDHVLVPDGFTRTLSTADRV